MTEGHSNEIDPEHRRRLWKEHIDRWRQSGLTQEAYCREHDLKPHQLTYWKKRFFQADKPISFIPLRISCNQPAAIPATPFNLVTPNGYKIQVGTDFDPAALKLLLSTVQSL